jgi:hypothetical protein
MKIKDKSQLCNAGINNRAQENMFKLFQYHIFQEDRQDRFVKILLF